MKRALLWGSGAVGAAAAVAMLGKRSRIDVRGRVVLITGGSRGLGLALAREFASRGANLALCARSGEELDRASGDLAHYGRHVFTVTCDVTDRAQVEELVRRTTAEFGRIDIVVNNAGSISVGPVDTMTVDDFQHAMDVMFWGVVYTTLAALPHIRRGGRIANVTSIGGKVSVPHLVPYSCAKFAAVGFSEGMRAELNHTGIKVVTIAPGLMRTGSFVNARFKGAEEGEAAWFGASSSLPFLSMSAGRAARQIVDAIERGRAERILTTQANLLERFHGLFPEVALGALSLVSRLLPHGSQRTETGKDSAILRKPWMRALMILGRRAAKEYLQPAGV